MKIPIPKNQTLKTALKVFGFSILVGLALYFLDALHVARVLDPDTYYHLAIAREATPWWKRIVTLPQAEGLGWHHYFPDKEFLFHSWLKLMFSWGGEKAVFAFAPIFFAAALAMSLSLLSSNLLFALVPALLCLATQSWVQRFLMVRPHICAIGVLMLLTSALATKHKRSAIALCAFFPLLYHALYLPVVIVIAYGVLYSDRRTTLLSLLALAAGILLNPYFPSNLELTLFGLKVALSAGSVAAAETMELRRLPILQLLLQFLSPLAVFLAIASRWKQLDQAERFLLSLAALWWLLGLVQPRSLELAVPFTMLLMALFLQKLTTSRVYLWAGAALLLQIPQAWDFGRWRSNFPTPVYMPALVAETLVKVRTNAKVYHCSWHWGSYLLYTRPDLRFIDLLDPNFLENRSPEIFKLRQALNNGMLAHPDEALAKVFEADYVICERHFGLPRQLLSSKTYRLDKTPNPLGLLIFSREAQLEPHP